MFLAITLCTHMCFFRSHQISREAQRCARVVFRLKWSNRQLFSARMGKLVQSTYQGASNFLPIMFIVHSFFCRFSIMQTFFNFLTPWKSRMLSFEVPKPFCLMHHPMSMPIRFRKIYPKLAKCGLIFLTACRIFCFQAFLRRVTFACLSNCPKLAF